MRRRLTIEIYKGRGRQPWRWRLLARNYKIIADCAEGYASRRNVMRAATNFRGEMMACSGFGVDVMDKDPLIGCWRKLA